MGDAGRRAAAAAACAVCAAHGSGGAELGDAICGAFERPFVATQ